MSLESSELVVGANGSIEVAPHGTTLPTDIDDVLAGEFTEIGYTTEEGVKFTDAKSIKDKKAWQSFYPVRKIVESRDAAAAFVLEQWNRNTVLLAFGGGEVVSTSNGYRYNPPDPADLDERSVVIAWTDDTKNYRIVIPKCIVSENVETNIMRTDTSDLPITLGVIGIDGSEPWYLLTDDENFSVTEAGS